jgi:ATP/maltotriose-dependent transcriptional regulator MalT
MLHAALEGAVSGAVIAGAPGVGKSRLSTTFLESCTPEDYTTALVRCTRSTASIPFGPFARYAPTSSVSLARLDVLRRIAEQLVAQAAGRRLVVAIDDAHLLDEGSAALALHLVTNELAFVVATVRSGESAPDAVTALWKEGLAERIELQALSRPEAGDLLAALLGDRVDLATVHRLWEATGGNPLFLCELVRSGHERGSLEFLHGVWHWDGALVTSSRLAELVADRIATTSPDEHRLLELLAVGEPLSPSMLSDLTSAAALESAERRGAVVVDIDDRRRRVRFSHPLYGEVLRSRMPRSRADELYGLLAGALDATAPRLGPEQLLLAHWRMESNTGIVDAAQFEAAARQALSMSAYTLAERLANAAVVAGGGDAARVTQGESLYWQRRFGEAHAALQNIPAETTLPDADRARAAIVHSSVLFWGLGRSRPADELLRRTESALATSPLAQEVRAHRASLALFEGRTDEAIDESVAVLADPNASEAARVRALSSVVTGWAETGRVLSAVGAADGGLDSALALAAELPQLAGELMLGKCLALFLAGQLEDAEQLAIAVHDVIVAEHLDDFRGTWLLFLGRIALAQGRVSTAAVWLEDGAVLLRYADPGGLLPWCLALLGQANALLGRTDAARRLLDEARTASSPVVRIHLPERLVAEAWLLVALGELTTARARINEAVAAARQQHAPALEAAALHDLVRLGEAKVAATRLGELGAQLEGPFASLWAQHAVALGAGDGHALDAVAEGFASIGALLFAGEAASEASVAHASRGLRAREVESAGRARGWARACEGATTPALHRGADVPELDMLTAREREVVELAAGGLLTREIADRLFVSMRTVSNHLQHAYAKLGVSDRVALRQLLAIGASE